MPVDEETKRLNRMLDAMVAKRKPATKLFGGNEMTDNEQFVLDEYDEQMMDNEMKKWQAYQAKKQRQIAENAQAKIFQETMKSVAQEHEMTVEELGEVLQGCPFPDAEESLKQNLRQHMKNMIGRSKSPKARRERDRDGRFVSTKSSQIQAQSRPAGGKSVDDVIKGFLNKAGRDFLP